MAKLALIATIIDAQGVRTLPSADRAAVELARQSGESAVFCPMGDTLAVEYAMAAGIPEVVELQDVLPEFDVAYVGTGWAELAGDVSLARWAEFSKATLLFDVLRVSEQLGMVREVECDAGRGARHLLRVRGPMILVLSRHAARPAYVSRYRRQIAAQQLSTAARAQEFCDLNTHEWGPMRPRVRPRQALDQQTVADDRLNDAFSIQSGSTKELTNVIVADPETCARHILRYLAHHSLVSRVTPADRLEMPTPLTQSTEPLTEKAGPYSTGNVSLGRITERRPRQASDSPARRARQPRVIGKVLQLSNTASLGEFMERRPRQDNDSAARRARQPRPSTKA